MRVFAAWGFLMLAVTGNASAASIAGSRASADRLTANLEERSKRKLQTARRALRSANVAYRTGDAAGLTTSVLAIERGVDQAYEFLVETGENPRAMPQYFKHAEIEIRHLYRRLDYFESKINNDDRALLEAVKDRVQQIEHKLLIGITTGTKLERGLLIPTM